MRPYSKDPDQSTVKRSRVQCLEESRRYRSCSHYDHCLKSLASSQGCFYMLACNTRSRFLHASEPDFSGLASPIELSLPHQPDQLLSRLALERTTCDMTPLLQMCEGRVASHVDSGNSGTIQLLKRRIKVNYFYVLCICRIFFLTDESL